MVHLEQQRTEVTQIKAMSARDDASHRDCGKANSSKEGTAKYVGEVMLLDKQRGQMLL